VSNYVGVASMEIQLGRGGRPESERPGTLEEAHAWDGRGDERVAERRSVTCRLVPIGAVRWDVQTMDVQSKKYGAVVMARGAKLVGFVVVEVKNRTQNRCLKSLTKIY
jgi:hypothetical protein